MVSFKNWLNRSKAAQAAQKKASIAAPDASLLSLFGVQEAPSGVSVTPRSAMRCAPVRCAVQTIAEAIGQLPVDIFAAEDGDVKERDAKHAAFRLLNLDSNDWTPASKLREQLTRDALLWGNGYAFINRIEDRPVELIRCHPEAVTVEFDPATGEPSYRLGEAVHPRRSIFHIAAPSIDGVAGDSPVRQASEAIGLALVMEQHAARLFGRGARPSGILSTEQRMDTEAMKRVIASWQAAHGAGKSGGTAVLEAGMSFQQLALSSVDAQFLELRKFAIDEIARVFRVPPHMLMELGRATWANSEDQGKSFVQYTLLRWIKAWEGEVRLKLFSSDEREHYSAEFDVDDLLRADLDKRATAYAKMIAARIVNPNEVRAWENLAPYQGGDEFGPWNKSVLTDPPRAEGVTHGA